MICPAAHSMSATTAVQARIARGISRRRFHMTLLRSSRCFINCRDSNDLGFSSPIPGTHMLHASSFQQTQRQGSREGHVHVGTLPFSLSTLPVHATRTVPLQLGTT